MNKLDKYIIFSAAVLLTYTAIALLWSWFDHIIPSELTVALYAAFGSEIWAAAWIKKLNLREGRKGDE
jgi:hypothetical protein